MTSFKDNKLLSSEEQADLAWCYDMLDKTSRSFAAVIKALGPELRDAVMIFYLVLRGLDSVEDDTSYPKEKRIPILRAFHTYLTDEKWHLTDCGEKEHERVLLGSFFRVNRIFNKLKPEFRNVIADICNRMGNGMADFIVTKEVVSVEDWNLYCHYVAGLVGIGLSGLFAHSGLEDMWYATADKISNNMGLFLQKTNIIRDYREDIDQGRIFWPKDIWYKYADRLEDFKEDKYAKEAVHCLNHLITNALQLIPDCFEYMSKLKDTNVFLFCAIPQAMAIATLELCYENHDVFLRNVKIQREETERIIKSLMIQGLPALYSWYYYYLDRIAAKVKSSDPNRIHTLRIINEAKKFITSKCKVIPIAKL